MGREREVLTVALAAGRHVLIEGPPGTGKSTLLRSVAAETGQRVVFAEGNAELTPARLVGAFDPAQVLSEGYTPGAFADGPMLSAVRDGGLLYLEEFNRVPEETLNVLITVLTEGEITVPRLATVRAHPGFRLIGAMNPFDAIGTARVSQAIADRVCRVVLDYQDEAAERAIAGSVSGLDGTVVDFSVGLTRATRCHRDVRMGSSVRGAIDMSMIAAGLGELRHEAAARRETARDAAHAALSGRIRTADGVDRSPESIIDELLEKLWPTEVDEDSPTPPEEGGPGKADSRPGPGASQSRQRPGGDRSGRTLGRRELGSRHAAFEQVSPETGELDIDAFEQAMTDDPEAAVGLLADLAVATDATLRAAARQLAGRVFIRLGRLGKGRARGTRRLEATRGGDGDLDLEATLDSWAPTPAGRPGADDLVTRSWAAHRRAACLAVDVSGSMHGLAVALAAVAASGIVLAGEQAGQDLVPAVLAFGAEVRVLQHRGVRRSPEELVGELVALRGHGVTDLAGALRAASTQLAGAGANERLVLLLSDCIHTTGDDPASALAGIDRLEVLLPQPESPDPDTESAAAGLAARAGGTSRPVRRLAEIAPALGRVLAE
jgi:gas vesicle protein GvpN